MARPAGAGPRWQVQHADAGGWYDDKNIHIAAPLVGTTVAKEFADGGLAAGQVKKIEESIVWFPSQAAAGTRRWAFCCDRNLR